jgi:hypothetical protein
MADNKREIKKYNIFIGPMDKKIELWSKFYEGNIELMDYPSAND